MPYIEYKQAHDLVESIKTLIMEQAELNFIVYLSNPIKIITVFLFLLTRLNKMYPLLKFKIEELSVILNKIAIEIMINSKNIADVKDMILDYMYNGTQIVDMLAFIDNIPILQSQIMDSVVSNMYYGPYERQFFLKNSI